MLVEQWVFGAKRTNLHEKYDYPIWPQAEAGAVALSPAQLSMLLEGIDWRMPVRTHTPELAA